jgi:hypothetical protein
MGHVGLTPQSVSAIGGFRPQAQHAKSALQFVQAARVGAFLMPCGRPPTMQLMSTTQHTWMQSYILVIPTSHTILGYQAVHGS